MDIPMSEQAQKPEPHPGAAASAIAGMALVVAVVLQQLGSTGKIDSLVHRWSLGFGLDGMLQPLAPWISWIWTIGMTFGICQAMLHAPRHWRRSVLMVTSLLLTVAWVPVLAMAGFTAPIGVAIIALFWGGVGSIAYAIRHREPE